MEKFWPIRKWFLELTLRTRQDHYDVHWYKKYARKWCLFLGSILYEVASTFWKMCDHTRKMRCTLHLNSASGIKMTTVSSEKNPWFCDRNASLVALAGTNMLFFWICSAQSTSGGGFWGSFHLWSFRTPRIWSIVRMVGFPEAMAVWAIKYGGTTRNILTFKTFSQ